jgi:LPS sulfotransferase NodH
MNDKSVSDDDCCAAVQPWLVWAICTVARSGSSWLSQLVSSTGIMGHPDEYLLSWPQQATRRGLAGSTSFSDYLTFLLQHRSTANGVFAVKGSVEEMQPFFDFFPNAPCVWLVRENKIQQAVSWHRAHDGGVWTRTASAAEQRPFEFSVDRFLYFYDEIIRREALWQEFFSHRPVPPLVLTYEQVCEAPLAAVQSIAAHIGLNAAIVTDVSSPLQIVRDETNETWIRRAQQAILNRDTQSPG